jgi:hypothetical protein
MESGKWKVENGKRKIIKWIKLRKNVNSRPNKKCK